MVKQLRQVAGVRQVKVVDYRKGIFALTPKKGANLSESAITAAVKRSGFTSTKIVAPGGKSSQTDGGKTGKATGEKLSLADLDKLLIEPRAAFRKRDYQQALKLAQEIVVRMDGNGGNRHANRDDPAGSEAFQFLSLANFSAGKFDDAANSAHVALHRGPHWKWKSLSGYYANTEQYTSQLRALEESLRTKPSAEKRFLIGYHYLMLGYTDAARGQLTRVAEQNPKDDLVRDLLKRLTEKRDSKASSKKTP